MGDEREKEMQLISEFVSTLSSLLDNDVQSARRFLDSVFQASTPLHIRAHFLECFVSAVKRWEMEAQREILTLLQKKIDPTSKIAAKIRRRFQKLSNLETFRKSSSDKPSESNPVEWPEGELACQVSEETKKLREGLRSLPAPKHNESNRKKAYEKAKASFEDDKRKERQRFLEKLKKIEPRNHGLKLSQNVSSGDDERKQRQRFLEELKKIEPKNHGVKLPQNFSSGDDEMDFYAYIHSSVKQLSDIAFGMVILQAVKMLLEIARRRIQHRLVVEAPLEDTERTTDGPSDEVDPDNEEMEMEGLEMSDYEAEEEPDNDEQQE